MNSLLCGSPSSSSVTHYVLYFIIIIIILVLHFIVGSSAPIHSVFTAIAMAAPGSASGSAKTLLLAELHARSAPIGKWDVDVFRPSIQEYKWMDKKTGQEKTGAEFRCILISRDDHSQYVNAHWTMRQGKMEPLKTAQDKFQPNAAFRMSHVKLFGNAQQQYLHTPIKLKINLEHTTTEKISSVEACKEVQPTPGMTIIDCKKLQQTQRFDVTAIMDMMTEIKTLTGSRQVVTITLIDDSGEAGNPAQMTVSFYMEQVLSKEEAATLDILQEAYKSDIKPVLSFFAVQGKNTDKIKTSCRYLDTK